MEADSNVSKDAEWNLAVDTIQRKYTSLNRLVDILHENLSRSVSLHQETERRLSETSAEVLALRDQVRQLEQERDLWKSKYYAKPTRPLTTHDLGDK